MKPPRAEQPIDHTGHASRDSAEESVETGTDVDKVSGLDETNASTKPPGILHERHPERDEHGRL